MHFNKFKYYVLYVRNKDRALHKTCTLENLETVQKLLEKQGYTIEFIEFKSLDLCEPTTEDIATLTAENL